MCEKSKTKNHKERTNEREELSDEELEAVAGGTTIGVIIVFGAAMIAAAAVCLGISLFITAGAVSGD